MRKKNYILNMKAGVVIAITFLFVIQGVALAKTGEQFQKETQTIEFIIPEQVDPIPDSKLPDNTVGDTGEAVGNGDSASESENDGDGGITDDAIPDNSEDDSLDIFIRGDADGSGTVNMADALCISRYINGMGPEPIGCDGSICLDAGDVNDDEGVNQADVVYLLSYLYTVGPEPMAPFPNCGVDETTDLSIISFIRGDADGDGEITVADANYILDYLFNDGDIPKGCNNQDNWNSADVDDNEIVEYDDVVYLLNYLYLPESPEPPEPFNECGLDPTPNIGSTGSTEIPFIRGDADGSGTVTLDDASYIMNFIFNDGPAPMGCDDQACWKSGDTDGNGLVEEADAYYILDFLYVPEAPEPSAPFPDCGL